MNPPARSLRTELHEALIRGIRQHFPEAVGLLIMAATRIVIALLVLGLQLLASLLMHYDLTSAWPFSGMLTVSGLMSWLLTHKRGRAGDDERGSS